MEGPYRAQLEVTVFRSLAVALTVVLITTASEFFFRHFVMYWFPTIGDLRVNDMISLLVVYAVLLFVFGLATHTDWKRQLPGVGLSIRDMAKTWDYVPWLLLMALSLALLPPLDHVLWGKVQLMPWFASSYHNSLKLCVARAAIVKVIALISVNGFFVPVAEEFIWRGIVQDRFLRLMPAPLAIGITAVLFSFKHVVVDDSFGRFLSVISFGAICGVVAYRKSWRASAAVHLLTNTVGTIMALALHLI